MYVGKIVLIMPTLILTTINSFGTAELYAP